MIETIRRNRRLLYTLLALAAVVLYFAHIGTYHLIDPDEGRYHRVAMEMVLSGDYVTPHFDYMPYFEKPIFQYWVTALSMELFGFREFTGRVLPALTGLGNAFLACWLGSCMYGRRVGILAGVILATTALQLIVASIGVLDMALTFFIDLCLVSFYVFEQTEKKKYLLLFYASMACGMLTKGLIAIVFPCGIIFWYALVTRRFRLFWKLFYLPGIALFLAIAVPWYYLVCQANPDFFYFFFIREHFLRFATKMHARFHPWYYFVPVVIAGFMPWTGFFLTFFSKKGIFRCPGTRKEKNALILLCLWAGLIYAFYSISDSKLPTYILPCWLPAAVLLAASLERCRQAKSWLCHGFFVNSLLCLLFTGGGVAYLMHTDFLTIADFFQSGFLVIASLFVGTLLAAFLWYRRRDFTLVFVVLSCMAYLFGIGAHQIQGQIHNHQTAYYLCQRISGLQLAPDTPIVMYGNLIPGLVYYLDRPIQVSEYEGELQFGMDHTGRSGVYYSKEQLIDRFEQKQPTLVVVQPKYYDEAMETLDGLAGQRIDLEDYTVFVSGDAGGKNDEND